MISLLQFALLALVVRCFYLQIVRGPVLAGVQRSITTASEPQLGRRGSIVTSDGLVLAEDSPRWRVAIDPDALSGSTRLSPEARDAELSRAITTISATIPLQLEQPDNGLLLIAARESMRRDRHYLRLGWVEGSDAYQALQRYFSQLPHAWRRAFNLEISTRRAYPQGNLARQLVGPVHTSDFFSGIERGFDSVLSSRRGLSHVEKDVAQRRFVSAESANVEPVHGQDLVLTIDSRAQRLLETLLLAAKEKHGARTTTGVVLEPHSGAVIATASMPRRTDAADSWSARMAAKDDDLRRSLQSSQLAYEPGSIVKPLILAQVLTAGIDPHVIVKSSAGADQTFQTPGYAKTVHDETHRGPLNIIESVVFSSNIGLANVGLKLGRSGLVAAHRRFSLDQKTGFGLGEKRGRSITAPSYDWKQLTTICSSYGYEFSLTPLQIARAYCALANGGFDVRPHVVRRGLHETLPEERVSILAPEIARQVRDTLRRTVVEGSGIHLKDLGADDILLAGKTGTARKWQPDKRYDGHYATFAGFAPVDNPRFVVVIVIEEPQGEYFGGRVAGPVATQLLRGLLNQPSSYFAACYDAAMREMDAVETEARDDVSVDARGGSGPWTTVESR
ncbi:MAG: peptidoglycan D,D-transpeptidase FtsI family protein [Planctomycetota bacterium]